MSTHIAVVPPRAMASLFFIACLVYCALVQAACSCFSCLSGESCTSSLTGLVSTSASGEEVVPIGEFRIGDRWQNTATDGFSGNSRGTPRTLTWGIVPDGTSITGGAEEPTAPSNLIARLDTIYGTSGGADLTTRSWYTHFEDAFERWEDLSGLTFNYEPNDGGAAITNFSNSQKGVLGSYADHRIGGHPIDGNSGTLAYNYFPDHADMVIDTNDSFYTNTNLGSIRLENVLMHEIGHGIGIRHVISNDSNQLMEPFINTSFRGPQIDDILAVHRNYGDVHEKNGGNDTPATAMSLGTLSGGDSWSIGTDGSSNSVNFSQVDFISIDGNSDDDYFVLNVSQSALIDITLTQVGITYNEGQQDDPDNPNDGNGAQSPFDTSSLNPLSLSLLDSSVTLSSGTPLPLGNGESISAFTLSPGTDYYLHVEGSVDNVQLYQLDVALTAVAVPEPTALVMLSLFSCTFLTCRNSIR